MWNNQKQKNRFSLCQTYKLTFILGKWLIHGTKRRNDNQLQILELPCRISKKGM